MFKKVLFLSIGTLSLFLNNTLEAKSRRTPFIIVHGTWAQSSSWHQPGGDFFTALSRPGTMVMTFTWSGKNNHNERIKAAHNLAHLIHNLGKAHLITHSHGGNVGILASQLLAQQKSSAFIDHFYALGTPVAPENYQPDMSTIKYLCNFFSCGDVIQPVLGLFERTFAPHERIINIRTAINNEQPTHSDLHHPLIAHWLPSLNAKALTPSRPLFINFSAARPPLIMVDHEQSNILELDRWFQHTVLTTAFDRKRTA